MFEDLEKRIDEAFISDNDMIFEFANKLANGIAESINIHMSHPVTHDGIKIISHLNTFLNIIPEDQQANAYNAIKSVENSFEALLDVVRDHETKAVIIKLWGKIIDIALSATKMKKPEPELSIAENKNKQQ